MPQLPCSQAGFKTLLFLKIVVRLLRGGDDPAMRRDEDVSTPLRGDVDRLDRVEGKQLTAKKT